MPRRARRAQRSGRLWHPDRLERAVELFADTGELSLVHGDAVLVDRRGRSPVGATCSKPSASADAGRAIHRGSAIELLAAPQPRHRRDGNAPRLRWRSSEPVPAVWVHDEWLAIVSAAARAARRVAEPLIDYRQHGVQRGRGQEAGLPARVRRMLEPGAERSARIVERAGALARSVPDLVPRARGDGVEKLEHERDCRRSYRARAGSNRFPANWSTGGYQQPSPAVPTRRDCSSPSTAIARTKRAATRRPAGPGRRADS